MNIRVPTSRKGNPFGLVLSPPVAIESHRLVNELHGIGRSLRGQVVPKSMHLVEGLLGDGEIVGTNVGTIERGSK
jgi:hypothetical protein